MIEQQTTPMPERDGDRTDDIGMLSVPIYMEHGDQYGEPYIGYNFMVGGGFIDVPDDLMDEYIDRVQREVERRYEGDLASVTWLDETTTEATGVIEFTDEVLPDDTLDSWVRRVTDKSKFFSAYDDLIVLGSTERMVADEMGEGAT